MIGRIMEQTATREELERLATGKLGSWQHKGCFVQVACDVGLMIGGSKSPDRVIALNGGHLGYVNGSTGHYDLLYQRHGQRLTLAIQARAHRILTVRAAEAGQYPEPRVTQEVAG